jgi:hypothetical protein
MRKLAHIVYEVARLEETMAGEERQHEQKMKMYERQLKEARAKCPHPAKDYHPDASGGTDSWSECQLCGEILK